MRGDEKESKGQANCKRDEEGLRVLVSVHTHTHTQTQTQHKKVFVKMPQNKNRQPGKAKSGGHGERRAIDSIVVIELILEVS